MEYRKKLSIAILIITIILDIVCLVVLPSTIAVHWDSAGTANGFLPTYQAVLISTVSTIFCLWVWKLLWTLTYNKFQNNPALEISLGEAGSKVIYAIVHIFSFIFSCVGIVVNIAFLILN